MKKADEAVEKVLAGLGGVQVEAGFEDRVVRRVREAARERGAGGRFGLWQWVAVGCVAVLLVGVGVSWRVRERRDFVVRNAGVSGDAGRRAGVERGGGIEEGVSQRLKPGNGLKSYGTAEAVPLTEPGSSGGSNSSRDGRSFEFAGAVGGGFPAPPLPLTAQERLLLRAAQDGDARPVAVLEVSVLPAHDAEETAEFVEFFERDRQVEPNTPGDSE